MKPLLSKAIRPFIWALSAGLCITASAQTPVAAEPLVDVESPQAAPAKPSGMRELVLLVLQNQTRESSISHCHFLMASTGLALRM